MKTDKLNGTCDFEYCRLKYDYNTLQVSSFDNSKTQTIKRINIGEISSEFIIQLANVFTYCLRFFLAGFVLIIFSIIISVIGYELISDIFTVISYIIFGLSIILWFISVLDAMIGSRIGYSILSPIFGSKGNRIIVKNTNSINALGFYVGTDEVKMLEKFIDGARLEKPDIVNHSSNTQSTSLDELEKLANLRDKGVITEDEFNAKKKSLLEL